MVNTIQQAKHTKLIFIILVLMFTFLGTFVYFGVIKPQQRAHAIRDIKIEGVFLPQATEINNFNLTDNHGNPFTKESLKGHWTMMFFGFTNCGMVCPTTMAAMNKMYKLLQQDLPQDKMPKVVMISVDPDRDSVEKMNQYVTTFNSNFIGARAEIEETVALEKQLHIVAAKIETDGEGKNHYTINHTADVLLINPDARVQAFLSFPPQPEQLAKDYKLILTTLSS